MVKCKICEKEFKNLIALCTHVNRAHRITSIEYYDKYLKKSWEGVCLKCGRKTKFLGLGKAYSSYCSCSCAQNSKKVREEFKKTMLKKYGVESACNLKEIKEQIKQTNLKKYGVEWFLQSTEAREKSKQTNIKKYGTENPSQSHIINFDKWKDVEFIKENFLTDKNNINYKEMMEFFNIVSESSIYRHIKHLNIEYNCVGGTSSYELEIYEFLRHGLGILNIIQNDRQLIKPFEVDFLLPDFSFAIEFNGMYWHSDEYKTKDYHQNKTLLCKNKGVSLVHIWEDKWLENKEIFKQILKNELHKNLNNIP